jgi:murein DD-endopeptidase MepM/ murein hydrolase activator NlpD
MAVAVILLSRVDLPQWDIVRVAPLQAEDIGLAPEPAFDQLPVGGSPLQEGGLLLRAPVPFTEIPDRPRTGIITYTVQSDDTILGIAEKFSLNPTTILWANQADPKDPFVMEVGQVMTILPIDGVLHTTVDGDTVEKIAKLYKSTADQIVAYAPNQLPAADAPLTVGQAIIVPDGDKTPPEEIVPAPGPRGGGSSGPAAPWRANGLIWPAYGPITQRFYRGVHPAIDIGARMGSPAYAADEGTVIGAGWSSVGYGNHVYIQHPDGFVTLYAHLSRVDVSYGDYVARGQQIGAVGSTGRSTGPHLHFEISVGGRTYNPLVYLE